MSVSRVYVLCVCVVVVPVSVWESVCVGVGVSETSTATATEACKWTFRAREAIISTYSTRCSSCVDDDVRSQLMQFVAVGCSCSGALCLLLLIHLFSLLLHRPSTCTTLICVGGGGAGADVAGFESCLSSRLWQLFFLHSAYIKRGGDNSSNIFFVRRHRNSLLAAAATATATPAAYLFTLQHVSCILLFLFWFFFNWCFCFVFIFYCWFLVNTTM